MSDTISAATTTEEPVTPLLGVAPRRWTVAEYHRAAEDGIFRPDERLELIDGEVIAHVSPIGSHHRGTVYRVAHALERALGSGYYVDTQAPLTLGETSDPQSDVLVAVGSVADYDQKNPAPAETVLVVEASDTTLEFDRRYKANLYATAGIKDYWIINLKARTVEVHRHPTPTGYNDISIVAEVGTVSVLGQDDAPIAVRELLPVSASGD